MHREILAKIKKRIKEEVKRLTKEEYLPTFSPSGESDYDEWTNRQLGKIDGLEEALIILEEYIKPKRIKRN